METINKQTPSDVAREQATSATPQRKGGFVQGAAVAQGCCGETSSTNSGCCGAPAQTAAPTASVQLAAQGGCGGTAVPKSEATTASSGCCG